jgi:hypothetical protein
MNKIGTKKYKESMERKLVFWKINNSKPFTKLAKRRREKTQINKIRDEKEASTTNTMKFRTP